MRKDSVDEPQVLTLAEAARLIRVSNKTLGEMARRQRIPCQKAGREWRFLRDALEAWLQGQAGSVAESGPRYRQTPLAERGQDKPGVKAGFGDTAFSSNRREPLHRWVPWIAGFSAAFVEDVFDTLLPAGGKGVTILDPFAGVGTTLVEALKRGYRVAGFEINPFAALACRTKLGAAGWEKDSFAAVIERFRQYMRKKARSGTARPKSRPPAHFRTKRPFFSPAVERQVLFVQDFINLQRTQFQRDLLKVALGAVMVSFSNYSYEPSLGTRAAAGKSDILDADVPHVLENKLWQMEADIGFLQEHLRRFDRLPDAYVESRSYLLAGQDVAPGSVDLLITSPPYLNNYHYIRNTRPQLYWLDLVGEPKDLKQMEVESFGQFWQTVRAAPTIRLRVDIPELERVVQEVSERNPEKGVYGGKGWANYAAAYFNDCARFCTVTRTLMKPGGSVVVVIGNNILQGVEVRTDEFFAQIAELEGFSLVDMHRVRTKRTGSSIVNSSVRAGKTKKPTELYETAVELRTPV